MDVYGVLNLINNILTKPLESWLSIGVNNIVPLNIGILKVYRRNKSIFYNYNKYQK